MDINIIIGILGVVVALAFGLYQFTVIPKKEIKESKIALAALFNTSQHITVDGYIRYLEDLEKSDLSNTLLTNITNEDLSKDIIITMTERLNQQIHSFNKSMAYFQTRFKYR